MDVSELNKEFSLDGVLEISEVHNGFPFVNINNQYASAVISLYGGQVLSYADCDTEELLFLSDKAFYETGKAIKGGVPVCWPWFGADPEAKGRSAHGFARNSLWQIESTEQLVNGSTKVVICLMPNEVSKSLFPHDFKLSLTIVVGEQLELELSTKNNGQESFNITQALHTYFAVKNITGISVAGLDGCSYLDKAKSNNGEENKTQTGDILIGGEVDRIYLEVPKQIKIMQKEKAKTIFIQSMNNRTAVVWNPWKDLCEQSADLKPDDYTRFICVETANAEDDLIKVMPGDVFSLRATYSIG